MHGRRGEKQVRCAAAPGAWGQDPGFVARLLCAQWPTAALFPSSTRGALAATPTRAGDSIPGTLVVRVLLAWRLIQMVVAAWS